MTKKIFVHPLPLTLFSSNSAIFAFKKNRKGAEDVSSDIGEIDYEGNLKFKDNGDIDYGDGDLSINNGSNLEEDSEIAEGVLAMNSKKIEELNGAVQDIHNRLEKFDITMKGVRGDTDSLRDEIVQMNDSIKKMLCIYEAITQQYNPFIDESPTPRKEVVVEPAMRPAPDVGIEDEPMDRVIKPEDDEEEENLATVVGLNGNMATNAPMRSEPVKTSPSSISNDKVTVSVCSDTITVTPRTASGPITFQEACRERLSGVLGLMDEKAKIEEIVERVYTQQVLGQPMSAADEKYFRDWLRRMRG